MAKIKTKAKAKIKAKAKAKDVAAYILDILGTMTAMKLQRLAYYSQAWSLVWDEKSLFEEEIQAWANGPTSPELYRLHKGQFEVSTIKGGDLKKLTAIQKDSINEVLSFYSHRDTYYLSQLTHIEDPWKNARKGISLGVPSTNIITNAAMAEYYDSL